MKRYGFTLIEMIIVLGLVVVIMAFSIPKSSSAYQEWQQRHFWQEMKQEWQLAQVRSQNLNKITEISYDQQERVIIFLSENHERKVAVPHSIRVNTFCPRTMKSDGYIQPGTWCFADNLHHEQINLKIQMAGGGYRIEKKEFYSE